MHMLYRTTEQMKGENDTENCIPTVQMARPVPSSGHVQYQENGAQLGIIILLRQ